MNKQQQAEAVFAELDICQDGWITKGELELVDVVVVDVIADVIVVVCTLMGMVGSPKVSSNWLMSSTKPFLAISTIPGRESKLFLRRLI